MKNMKNTIEFICTENKGRSPVAELIAKDELFRRNILGYDVISSGISAGGVGMVSIPVCEQEEEIQYRAAAIKYYNIPGKVKQQSDQTVVSDNRLIILPMTQSHVGRVLNIYNKHEPPLVCALGTYALNDPYDVIDPWGQSQDVYFEMVEKLLDLVPQAIDRMVKEKMIR